MASSYVCNRGAQFAFCHDDVARFPAFVSGFRGGKSWAGARKAVRLARRNHTAGLLVAENYQQAKQVMAPAFLLACQEAGIGALWRPSDPSIVLALQDAKDTTHGGRVVVYIRSADTAERIAGFEIGWGWGDEVGRWPYLPGEPMRDPWTQCLARLSDLRSKLPQFVVTGTHEGHGTRLYDDWEGKPKPGHVLYRGSTRDNARHLESGYIRSLEQSYDPRLLEQYLEGNAIEMAAGLAYYAFGKHNHSEPEYHPNLPLWWTLDFNVAPMCSIVCQPQGKPPNCELHVIGEVVQATSANTADLCEVFAGRYSQHAGHVVAFGDASGGHADTRSRTDDWRLVQGILRRTFGDRLSLSVPASTPPVRQRVARVNAVCRDGTGRVRLRCDPRRVPYLARDLERLTWRTADQLDKRDQSLSHASDALGYLVDVAFPPAVATSIESGARGQLEGFKKNTPASPETVGGRPW